MIKCPSCQFEQPEDRLDCECCGLVFAKWKARNEPTPVEPAPPEMNPSAETFESPMGNSLEEFSGESFEDFPASGNHDRVYRRLAAVDFQRGPAGEEVYFPWGSFGKGFQGMDGATRMGIERFESQFSCVHCPALVILWMVALLDWLYIPVREYQGIILFLVYLAVSYGWFGWQANRWVSRLSPWPHKFDQVQYAKRFAGVFHWKFLIDSEVLSLFFFLVGLWLWLSGKFFLFFDDGLLVQRVWILLSGALLLGSSYFYYFRREPSS